MYSYIPHKARTTSNTIRFNTIQMNKKKNIELKIND